MIRYMTVTRAPGSLTKPMIRILNRLLIKAGFEIGISIEVTYEQGIITIRKLTKKQ